MAKKTAVNFANYDFTANPQHYTYEEITTIRRMTAAGEPIFLAPVEVHHREQLETLCISYDQCKTWRIGSESVTVHLTPASSEVYDLLLGDMRSRHRDAVRKCRCKIPGRRGKPIRCPDHYSCKDCPFGLSPDEREAAEISWDSMLEDGYEAEALDTTVDEAMAHLGREALIKKLNDADPRVAKAFTMEQDGYTIPEIMAELGLSQRRVYDLLKQAKTIAAKVL